MRCWHCDKAEADNQPRVYQEVATGKVYKGTRNFCSDGCEETYIQKMKLENPFSVSTDGFIRIS